MTLESVSEREEGEEWVWEREWEKEREGMEKEWEREREGMEREWERGRVDGIGDNMRSHSRSSH
jgi:hypothetical protein